MEKRGFCRNINFSAKSRIEKEHFFLEKTQPFLPIFFQKKTFIFVFFRLFRGGTGKNLYVYVYVYVYFYIYRVSFLSVLRTEKKQNHQVPSLYEGPRLEHWVFGKSGRFKIFGEFFKPKIFQKFSEKKFGKSEKKFFSKARLFWSSSFAGTPKDFSTEKGG